MPSIRTEPLVGSRTPRMMLMVVVLPAPLGPSKPTISFRATSNEIPWTAVVSPYFFDSDCTLRTFVTELLTKESAEDLPSARRRRREVPAHRAHASQCDS